MGSIPTPSTLEVIGRMRARRGGPLGGWAARWRGWVVGPGLGPGLRFGRVGARVARRDLLNVALGQ